MKEFDFKELKTYKGYGITKGWEIDGDGCKIKGTDIYNVFEDEDAIGESFTTLADAKKFIDSLHNKE